jgi:iron complex outermembrane receptor protein
MKETKPKYASLLFAALLCATAPCHAEEVAIEKIVVTSSRTQEKMRNSTKSITIIDQQNIQESNAQTIPDILRSAAGIQIRDYNGTGKQVNVDMGGFGETGPSNMLVLIDGRRVNAIDLSNTDWSQISLSQVERIEILRGASSVLYGDNASGGVVQIILKKGRGKPTTRVESRGGSYRTASTSIETTGSNDQSSARVSADYLSTDGYRKNSAYFRKDFGMRLEHAFNALLKTDFDFGYHTDRYGLPGALKASEISGLGRRATTKPNDSACADDWFAKLQIANDFGDFGKLATDFSVRTREVNASYVSMGWRNENHIVTLGLTPKYTLENSLFNKPSTFIFGLDIYHDQDDIVDGAFVGANDRIEINKTSLGIYGHEEVRLDEHLLLKTGVRQEYANYNFRQTQQVQLKEKSKLSETVASAGLAAPYGTDSSLFLDASTSFRYPLVDEFFTSNTYGFGGLKSSLEAQTGKNIEAGIRHFFTPDIHTRVAYFLHSIKNEIFYNPATFTNANYDHTLHQGIEFSSDIKCNAHLKFFTNYSFTRATFGKGAYKGKKIPGVPEHKTSVGLRFNPTQNLKINIIGNSLSSMFFISDEDNVFPRLKGWFSVDMNAAYAFGDFEIFCGINNILNTAYSEYGIISGGFPPPKEQSFYPAPERNVIAGLRYKF